MLLHVAYQRDETQRHEKSAPNGALFYVFILSKLDFEMESSFNAGSADTNTRTIWDTSPLEVRVDTAVATRVKLGSTN